MPEKAVIRVAELEWHDDELAPASGRQLDAAADALPAATPGSGRTGIAVEPFLGPFGALSVERVAMDTASPLSGVQITLPRNFTRRSKIRI